MKHLLAILLVIVSAGALGQAPRDENEVVYVGTTDPDMIEAIKRARESLDDFLRLASNPVASTTGYKLKVMVRDGSDVEHFWVIPFQQTQDGFTGVLANESRTVRNVRGGQTISFSRADISDWGYIKDGRQIGSFTVCVLFNKMPKEQADYYRKNHGFDCYA